MAASAKTRLGIVGGVLSACLVGALLACATGAPGTDAAEASHALRDVSVDRDGDATVVDLVGPEHAVFTAFLGQDPPRVVVDLSSVRVESAVDLIPVYDGLVEEVSVAEFTGSGGSPATRVELTLAREASYEVIPEDDHLAIRIAPVEGGEPAAAIESTPESEAASAQTADGGSDAMTEPIVPEGPPASHLLAIFPEGADEQGTAVRVRTDGVPANFDAFTLEGPDRLVIDLPQVQTEIPKNQVELGTPHASRARIGQHPDKVRIVIDAGSAEGPFEERQVVVVPDGLLVTLGTGNGVAAALAAANASSPPFEPPVHTAVIAEEAVPADAMVGEAAAETDAEAVPAAMASTEEEPFDAEANGIEPEIEVPMAETSAAEGEALPAPIHARTVRVYGVQYDAQPTQDRIAILSEHPVEYQLLRPDAETLIVSIPGGTLDPDAKVRLAPDDPGPVSLVSAFQQPDLAAPEVRVLVKRAPGLLPTVTRHGTMLFLDFARAGAHAETPPVIAALAQESATAPAGGPETAGDALVPMQPDAQPTPAPAAQKATESAAASIADDELSAALEPEQAIEVLEEGGLLDGKEYVGRRISLDFKDVDIQDVLRLIADVSDLNLIAGDEVEGKVTIRLVDVPWDQALDVILLTKGLGFVRVGNVLRIAPADILKQEEEARLQERRAKERLEDLVVKLQPVNYADVDEVSKMVKRLLTARGSVDVDKRTNTVIIKDIASVIDEATALIKAIDTQTPQVLIEAKVVEANLDFSRELGSEWGVGSNPDEDETDFNIAGMEPLTIQDTGFPFEQANNIVVKNPITSTATGLLNLGAFILDDRFDVDLRLAAAETEGEGKVISSPRVVTLDNREAIIQQGVSIPFQTFENGDAQLEFIDAVLMLKVTPHITADRSIIMKIEVSRNAPDDSVPTPTGSPAIAKNQAKTETLVRDGQTLVLGGIYVIQKTDNQSRVPFMHAIPVVGNFFKNLTIRDIRKELLIFVTPRVVVGAELPS